MQIRNLKILIFKKIIIIYGNYCYRYHDKKDVTDSPYNESKRSYAEKRGMTWLLQNKRPAKLKDSIRELEVREI